jgi:hypothetical protein
LLHRRFVLYPDTTPFTLKSAKGETVIKQIVSENCGGFANNPVRYRNGVTPGLSIEPDSGAGLMWTNTISTENVLDAIKKISALTLVDYTVDRIGPAQFLFRTKYPQLGNDLSGVYTFSPQIGNMVGPKYVNDYSDEVNAVVVLGPGQDGARLTIQVAGTDQMVSPWNVLEGTASPTTLPGAWGAYVYEAMTFAANQKLFDAQPKVEFTFDVLQSDLAAYGRDYRVGDLISANISNITKVLKVVGSSVQVQQGKETIKLTFSNLPLSGY